MTRVHLDPESVNYMIWRYLQESDFKHTAVMLQKEWANPDPEKWPGAKHVPRNALVRQLYRGLLYSEAERTKREQRGGNAALPVPGPIWAAVAPPSIPPQLLPNEDEVENARKRQQQSGPLELRDGSPAKRARLSFGNDAASPAPAVAETTPMDIDEPATNGNTTNGHAYPSPKEVERLSTPVIPTNGPANSIQTHGIIELGSDATTFLNLSSNPGPTKQMILHAEFHPLDPSILAAAGTDALARLWKIPRGKPSAETNGHVNDDESQPPIAWDIADEDANKASATMSALAWRPGGVHIALASDSFDTDEALSQISLWDAWGKNRQFLHQGIKQPIVVLRWSPAGSHLLVVSHLSLNTDAESSLVTILDPNGGETQPFEVPAMIDATWAADDIFIVCGGNILKTFKVMETSEMKGPDAPSGSRIDQGRVYETRPDLRLVKAAFDRRSQILAASTEFNEETEIANIEMWDDNGYYRTIPAHRSTITCLAWQPLLPDQDVDKAERLLVSADEEGRINIWSLGMAGDRAKFSMLMNKAVLAVAFTPDGAYLAAATAIQILIWSTADPSTPRARWVLDEETGWKSPDSNSSRLDDEEHQRCLSWDSEGKKLVYGVNNQLAVIRWDPLGES